MSDRFSRNFGPFQGHIWLNTAHQGALPRLAAEEAHEAIRWKVAPHELTTDRFNAVPARLKRALAQLVGASVDEIILANSASYGLHLLANGILWHEGDEVLVVGVIFVVNAAQALGVRPLDVRAVPVDAVIGVGFKWLCGPYGTGFCWMKSDLLASLQYNQTYWLTQMTTDDLGKENGDVRLPEVPPTARTYDVFGTANFFNFKPWAASVEYLLQQGIERIAEHDQSLVEQFISGLDGNRYEIISPRAGPTRSTLVFVSHRNPDRNAQINKKLGDAGIDVAYRRGQLRFSPHLYNTSTDIEHALAVLHSL